MPTRRTCAAPIAPRSAGITTSSSAERASPASPSRASCRQRRARARARPLRDRRAPDLRLRHPDRVAARDGADGRPPADVRPARRAHAARDVGALPWTFSTFDYPELCRCCGSSRTPRSRPPRSTAAAATWSTPTAATWRSVVVDALGWRRVLGNGYQPPDAPLSRGLEVHPWGAGDEMEIWIDRRYVPAGYGWSFPAADELRIGVGSFDPRFHVKDTTVLLAEDLCATRSATRATGSRTSCARRPRTASSSSATRPALPAADR